MEVEGRRRYIETIRRASPPASCRSTRQGASSRVNSAAAMRLLGRPLVGRGPPAFDVFGRADLQPFGALLRTASTGRRRSPRAQEIALMRGDREYPAKDGGHRLHGDGSEDTGARRCDPRFVRRKWPPAAWRDSRDESAHADSAVRRAPAPPFLVGAAARQGIWSNAPATIVGEVDSLKRSSMVPLSARMPALLRRARRISTRC